MFEIRVKLSAIGTAAERIFVGFTDVQEDTLTEMPFTIATTALTAVANPDDAIGFMWEGDATNASWYPASQNNDALTVDGMNMTAQQRTGPTADTWQTLKFVIGNNGKTATFSVDGVEIYEHTGTATVTDNVALTPLFVVTEGTAAINFDVDYIYVEASRVA